MKRKKPLKYFNLDFFPSSKNVLKKIKDKITKNIANNSVLNCAKWNIVPSEEKIIKLNMNE